MTRTKVIIILGLIFWLFLAPLLKAAPNGPRVSVTTAGSGKGSLVTFNVRCEDAPVSQVLTALFRQARVHFILDSPLSETISIHLEEVPLDEALRVIKSALVKPITYTKAGGVYRVKAVSDISPFVPKPYEPPENKSLPVQSRNYGTGSLVILPHPKVSPSAASSAPLSWGVPAPSGLQMGLWKPTNNDLLCVLRNAGPKTLRYNDCFLGSLVNLKVWARPHGTLFWTQARTIWPQEAIPGAGEGIGPTDKNFHDLPPGQEILKQETDRNGEDLYPKWYSPIWKNAFVIPLYAYDWPDSKTGVDIKVTQLWTLKDTDSVDSGVITLPVEAVSDESDLPPASSLNPSAENLP